MAYGDFKDLQRRTQSDKVLKDKAFEIESNPKYDGYQRANKPIIRKFKKEKCILLLRTIFGVLI